MSSPRKSDSFKISRHFDVDADHSKLVERIGDEEHSVERSIIVPTPKQKSPKPRLSLSERRSTTEREAFETYQKETGGRKSSPPKTPDKHKMRKISLAEEKIRDNQEQAAETLRTKQKEINIIVNELASGFSQDEKDKIFEKYKDHVHEAGGITDEQINKALLKAEKLFRNRNPDDINQYYEGVIKELSKIRVDLMRRLMVQKKHLDLVMSNEDDLELMKKILLKKSWEWDEQLVILRDGLIRKLENPELDLETELEVLKNFNLAKPIKASAPKSPPKVAAPASKGSLNVSIRKSQMISTPKKFPMKAGGKQPRDSLAKQSRMSLATKPLRESLAKQSRMSIAKAPRESVAKQPRDSVAKQSRMSLAKAPYAPSKSGAPMKGTQSRSAKGGIERQGPQKLAPNADINPGVIDKLIAKAKREYLAAIAEAGNEPDLRRRENLVMEAQIDFDEKNRRIPQLNQEKLSIFNQFLELKQRLNQDDPGYANTMWWLKEILRNKLNEINQVVGLEDHHHGSLDDQGINAEIMKRIEIANQPLKSKEAQPSLSKTSRATSAKQAKQAFKRSLAAAVQAVQLANRLKRKASKKVIPPGPPDPRPSLPQRRGSAAADDPRVLAAQKVANAKSKAEARASKLSLATVAKAMQMANRLKRQASQKCLPGAEAVRLRALAKQQYQKEVEATRRFLDDPEELAVTLSFLREEYKAQLNFIKELNKEKLIVKKKYLEDLQAAKNIEEPNVMEMLKNKLHDDLIKKLNDLDIAAGQPPQEVGPIREEDILKEIACAERLERIENREQEKKQKAAAEAAERAALAKRQAEKQEAAKAARAAAIAARLQKGAKAPLSRKSLPNVGPPQPIAVAQAKKRRDTLPPKVRYSMLKLKKRQSLDPRLKAYLEEKRKQPPKAVMKTASQKQLGADPVKLRAKAKQDYLEEEKQAKENIQDEQELQNALQQIKGRYQGKLCRIGNMDRDQLEAKARYLQEAEQAKRTIEDPAALQEKLNELQGQLRSELANVEQAAGAAPRPIQLPPEKHLIQDVARRERIAKLEQAKRKAEMEKLAQAKQLAMKIAKSRVSIVARRGSLPASKQPALQKGLIRRGSVLDMARDPALLKQISVPKLKLQKKELDARTKRFLEEKRAMAPKKQISRKASEKYITGSNILEQKAAIEQVLAKAKEEYEAQKAEAEENAQGEEDLKEQLDFIEDEYKSKLHFIKNMDNFKDAAQKQYARDVLTARKSIADNDVLKERLAFLREELQNKNAYIDEVAGLPRKVARSPTAEIKGQIGAIIHKMSMVRRKSMPVIKVPAAPLVAAQAPVAAPKAKRRATMSGAVRPAISKRPSLAKQPIIEEEPEVVAPPIRRKSMPGVKELPSPAHQPKAKRRATMAAGVRPAPRKQIPMKRTLAERRRDAEEKYLEEAEEAKRTIEDPAALQEKLNELQGQLRSELAYVEQAAERHRIQDVARRERIAKLEQAKRKAEMEKLAQAKQLAMKIAKSRVSLVARRGSLPASKQPALQKGLIRRGSVLDMARDPALLKQISVPKLKLQKKELDARTKRFLEEKRAMAPKKQISRKASEKYITGSNILEQKVAIEQILAKAKEEYEAQRAEVEESAQGEEDLKEQLDFIEDEYKSKLHFIKNMENYKDAAQKQYARDVLTARKSIADNDVLKERLAFLREELQNKNAYIDEVAGLPRKVARSPTAEIKGQIGAIIHKMSMVRRKSMPVIKVPAAPLVAAQAPVAAPKAKRRATMSGAVRPAISKRPSLAQQPIIEEEPEVVAPPIRRKSMPGVKALPSPAHQPKAKRRATMAAGVRPAPRKQIPMKRTLTERRRSVEDKYLEGREKVQQLYADDPQMLVQHLALLKGEYEAKMAQLKAEERSKAKIVMQESVESVGRKSSGIPAKRRKSFIGKGRPSVAKKQLPQAIAEQEEIEHPPKTPPRRESAPRAPTPISSTPTSPYRQPGQPPSPPSPPSPKGPSGPPGSPGSPKTPKDKMLAQRKIFPATFPRMLDKRNEIPLRSLQKIRYTPPRRIGLRGISVNVAQEKTLGADTQTWKMPISTCKMIKRKKKFQQSLRGMKDRGAENRELLQAVIEGGPRIEAPISREKLHPIAKQIGLDPGPQVEKVVEKAANRTSIMQEGLGIVPPTVAESLQQRDHAGGVSPLAAEEAEGIFRMMMNEEEGIDLQGQPGDIVKLIVPSEGPVLAAAGNAVESISKGVITDQVPVREINTISDKNAEEFASTVKQQPPHKFPVESIASQRLQGEPVEIPPASEPRSKEDYIHHDLLLHSFQVENYFQARGSTFPKWFPGIYSVFPEESPKLVLKKSPSEVLYRAWQIMKPKMRVSNK